MRYADSSKTVNTATVSNFEYRVSVSLEEIYNVMRDLFMQNGRYFMLYCDYVDVTFGAYNSNINSLFLIVLNDSPDMLEHIADDFITQEMCNFCVRKLGSTLCYVPEEFMTHEMCNYAVRKCPGVIRYVPGKFKSMEMCNYAASKNDCLSKYLFRK
jgi:hypothetical protein